MKKDELIKKVIAKNGTNAVLRPATVDDAVQIVHAAEKIIKAGVYIQKEKARTIEEEKNFIKELEQRNNMYIVIEIEKEVVGIARVIRGELEMKSHTGTFRTWLIDSAQGIGIGGHIMNYTLEWCRIHHLHKLCLTVFASNRLAQKLYEGYGFIYEGTQKQQIKINGRYDDEIFMAYFLQ